MSGIGFLFPGQGSQAVGMGQEFYREGDVSKGIFDKADERLGYSLSSLMFDGPQDTLTLTYHAQPALLTASTAILQEVKKAGIQPDFTAGHSLGEYSALVAAGVLSFEDAVYAVRKRGELMDQAVPAGQGAMAAVLGLSASDLQEVTQTVTSQGKVVQLANLNCPGQIVISGTAEGVNAACSLAKEKGAKRTIPLVVSGPFHSSLMKPAAEEFQKVLNTISFHDASVKVISNVSAQPVISSSDIVDSLIKQLYSPVRWEESIKYMLNEGVTTFVEIGPGKVLSGLVKKIDRETEVLSIHNKDSFALAMDKLKEEV
ncbi:ACP S-malonyltransferase [Bacillus lacus]|uniref:Malonyl CoA-acyl carrier protein transacylase n=1 Tax=Metabacillus lacus TaxID=1983721 RepID=A0A7X2IVL6_9BACI|nr:ACP S-malonyltransferase [Metabacillus lacus]MRX70560.1 ACP S-malonyltransferase [Metabacillus lacus]